MYYFVYYLNGLAFLELRRIETAKEIAGILSESRNHLMLNSSQLLLGLGQYELK